jgi:hypothetical protein
MPTVGKKSQHKQINKKRDVVGRGSKGPIS